MNAATGRSAEDPFGPWPRLVQVPRRRRHWQDKGQAMGSRAVREEGGRPARAALLGRHHCPHFLDASGQRGALTRARPPDPDHALPTPPCADRTSGALRRSQGAEAGSLGDTGGRGWSRQEAGGGGLGRRPQMCLSLCLRSRLGGAWLPRYGRSHDHGRGGAGPVPGRALRAGGGVQAWGGGPHAPPGPPLPTALPAAVLAPPEPHWRRGPLPDDNGRPLSRRPLGPSKAAWGAAGAPGARTGRPGGGADGGVGPRHQPHWGAPCARCQKGPDKLRAGKGTEVREQGRLRLPRDRGAEPGPSRAQQERRGARTPRASREPRAGPRQGWCRPTSTRRAACAGPRGPRCVLGTRAPPEGAGPAQASPCLLECGAPGGQEPQR